MTRLILSFLFALPLITCGQGLTVRFEDRILHEDLIRFGINLGSRSQWGAGQIFRNLVDNPGFEAGEYASVVLVADGASGKRVPQEFWNTSWNDDQNGVGWPVGFWTGAEYEFVWGSAKGRKGVIEGFELENGKNVFVLDSDGPAPERMSVMLVRRKLPGYRGSESLADPAQRRPGSPGQQSLHLRGDDNHWEYYMDSYYRDGDRSAGKLLIIRGEHVLRFWAKGQNPGDQLQVRFFREGETVFLDQVVSLNPGWQRYEYRVAVPDSADARQVYADGEYRPILGLSLRLLSGDDAWIDDIELYAARNDNATAFSNTLLDRLRELRPGVLRDWSAQLGSSLDNQLAVPFARRTNGYSPRGRTANAWCYSLHEFLELCREVGCEAWYVVPPTFSEEELLDLAEYLADPAGPDSPYAQLRADLGQPNPWTEALGRIYLEYGNEMWGSGDAGDPFMGSSVNGGVRLGAIANDRLGILRRHPAVSAGEIQLVIGGQAGYPGRQREIEQNSTAHSTTALAPYFGVLDSWSTDRDVFLPLFAAPFYQVQFGGMKETAGYLGETPMSIYEINFHTTQGGSPESVRNDMMTGLAGGLALPLHMLVYQREYGVRAQCAFATLQYSYRYAAGAYARLWGMLRDLESTGRKRPTWLGVELANRGILRNSFAVSFIGDNPAWTQQPINGVGEETRVQEMQAFAWGEDEPQSGRRRYSLALFNLSLDSVRTVTLSIPWQVPSGRARHSWLTSRSVHDDNEDSTVVRIEDEELQDFQDRYEITMTPHSLHVLSWDAVPVEVHDVPVPAPALAIQAIGNGTANAAIRYRSRNGSAMELRVFDLLGRLRLQRVIAAEANVPGRVSLPSGFPSGTYFVFAYQNGERAFARIILLN